MGMSASQARLIALTARMSDTEYEAQQINQQRLTLSNKMNEVYEAMCNMEVPTPPSKIDFKKESYTGKIGGNNITVVPDEETGQPIAYKEVKGSIVEQTAGTMGGNATISLAEVDLPKGEKTDGAYNEVEEGQSPEAFVSEAAVTVVDLNQLWIEVGTETITTGEKDANGQEVTKEVPKYGHPASLAVTGDYANTVEYFSDSKGTQPFTPQGLMVDIKSIGDATVASWKNGEYTSSGSAPTHGQTCFLMSKTGNAVCKIGVADKDPNTYSDSQISQFAQQYYVSDDGKGARKLTSGDFVNGKLKDGLAVLKQDKGGDVYADKSAGDDSTTVTSSDGKKTGKVKSIADAKDRPGFATAFEALKHRYEETGKSDKELQELFSVVDYGDGTYAFVLNTDLEDGDNRIGVYEVTEGKYKERMEDGTYTIERDVNGNVNKITTTDGASSALNTGEAYDELEYDAAMASYTAKKAEYDQEQNKLNKQTSIYQRQDKMLEMKLTRLDNERNALNTEIEAVKKVIQDAIDRGFKTFSG